MSQQRQDLGLSGRKAAEERVLSAMASHVERHGRQAYRNVASTRPPRTATSTWISSKAPGTRVALRDRLVRYLQTPKGQLLAVFLAMLAISVPGEQDWPAVSQHVLRIVAAATATDFVLGKKRGIPTGAPLTGLIIAMILAPDTAWYLGVAAAVVAIASKHFIRIGRENIFNPAALGLLTVDLVSATEQSWWGALGNSPAPWIAVTLVGGAIIAERTNKLPLVLTFLVAYFGLWTIISFMSPAAAAEQFRSPFAQAALFLSLFMLTDPPTSPIHYADQVFYGLTAAAGTWGAELLGAGQLFLLVGVLLADAIHGLSRLGAQVERRFG